MDESIDVSRLSLEEVAKLLPKPSPVRDFGDLGRLAIIGGSYLNMNPPIISAFSASKLSLDSIYLVIPEKHARIRGLNTLTISPILLPDFKITKGVVNKIIKYVKKKRINAKVFHLGPGLAGYRKYILELIKKLSEIEDSLLLLDSGSIYPEVLDLNLDWERIILAPHEGEIKQLIGINGDVNLDVVLDSLKHGYKYLLKMLDGLYFLDKDGRIKYFVRYGDIKPTRYGVTYVYTGLLSGFMAHLQDIDKAVILSQYTFIKTIENISVNGCLHWEIEKLIEMLSDTLKSLCSVK